MQRRFRTAGLQERFVDLGRAKVRYWIGGNGPPLVLLHGFGGDGTWAWHAQVAHLAKRHRLLIPDLLWFGGSSSASHDRSLFFQAEIASAVAEQAGMSRFDLCGISYGGLVAFTLANQYPDRVRRLVMVDSPGPAYTEEDNQQILTRYQVNSVADVVIPTDPSGVRTLLELAWERPPPTPEFVLRETWERVFTEQVVEKRGLLDWLDVRRKQPEVNPDGSLEQRTLVVWGANDPLFPLGVGKRLHAALPNASLFVIDKARHAPNLEHPGRFNRAVSDFLRT